MILQPIEKLEASSVLLGVVFLISAALVMEPKLAFFALAAVVLATVLRLSKPAKKNAGSVGVQSDPGSPRGDDDASNGSIAARNMTRKKPIRAADVETAATQKKQA